MSTRRDESRSAIGVVNVRDLARETSRIADEVEQGSSFLLTRRGVPIATVTPIDPDALEDFILANAPEFVASRRETDEALAAAKTESADDVFERVLADFD